MPPDENSPTPAEVPAPAPVPNENPPTPAAHAAPPATKIVVEGTKTEREIELERQLAERDQKLTAAERAAADLKFQNAELAAKVTAPAKKKIKRYLISPLIGADEEVEE